MLYAVLFHRHSRRRKAMAALRGKGCTPEHDTTDWRFSGLAYSEKGGAKAKRVRKRGMSDDRFGSSADIARLIQDVCFTLKSGHAHNRHGRPLSANNRRDDHLPVA